MAKDNRICLGYVDKVEDDNMIRYPRQRIVDMYKNAMSRVHFLEAKAKEVSVCSKCKNRNRTDNAYQEMLAQEQCLLRKLALKDRELQDHSEKLLAMQNSIKNKSLSSLKCTLQDPAVNILVQKLRQELSATKAKLKETQDELNVRKFTSDSYNGKRLMAKCQLLYQENEELGKIVNNGHVAKLEGELALQKNFGLEIKKSQSEMDRFLLDLDNDVESMQSTIYFLQNELLKHKTFTQCTINIENKESISKESINKYDVMNSEPVDPVSKSEITANICKSKHDNKICKTHHQEDLEHPIDYLNNHSKVKIFDMNESGKNYRVHACKHKLDGSRSGEKLKSEKRHCSNDE